MEFGWDGSQIQVKRANRHVVTALVVTALVVTVLGVLHVPPRSDEPYASRVRDLSEFTAADGIEVFVDYGRRP